MTNESRLQQSYISIKKGEAAESFRQTFKPVSPAAAGAAAD
jgi:hypothetical protein